MIKDKIYINLFDELVIDTLTVSLFETCLRNLHTVSETLC